MHRKHGESFFTHSKNLVRKFNIYNMNLKMTESVRLKSLLKKEQNMKYVLK